MLHVYSQAFEKSLDDLQREIESYGDEARMWVLDGDLKNSGGTLALHIVGNLQHFIGAELGGTGYVRDRDAEFTKKNVSRVELLARIAETRDIMGTVLGSVPDRDLEMEVNAPPFGVPQRLDRWLLHLLSHLSYHVGQVNYHRRLLDR